MTELAAVHATVYGFVQGVFFRVFVASQATELGLTGYVRNLPRGDAVEVQAEGERKQLEKLVRYLKDLKAGPPEARVKRVATNWGEYTGSYSSFRISY